MDDLLDLNFNSSPPSSSSNKSGFPKPPIANKPAHLLSSSTSTSASRSSSPAQYDFLNLVHAKGPSALSSIGNVTPQGNGSPRVAQTKPNVTQDAFSDLLSSFGPTSGTASSSSTRPSSGMGNGFRPSNGLTLVEQQAKLAQERKDKEIRDRQAFDFDSWGHALGGTGNQKQSMPTGTINNGLAFNNLHKPSKANHTEPLVQPVPRRAENGSKATNGKASEWRFDDLLGDSIKPSISTTPSKGRGSAIPSAQPTAQWDFETFGSSSVKKPEAAPRRGTFDFDNFGEAETSARRERQGSDDILGMLAKPVNREESGPSRQSKDNVPKSAVPQKKPAAARSTSPPPHIVGQIVEMGFSPAQARSALAKTPSGEDVQAAIDMLVGGSSQVSEPQRTAGRDRDRDSRTGMDLEQQYQQQQDDEEAERERRRRRRYGPPQPVRREADNTNRRERDRDDEQPFGDVTAQADKIMAQASEIGLNVFSKANSLWSQGKEKAQKLYEERQAAMANEKSKGKPKDLDSRPRWMIDAENAEKDSRSFARDERRSEGKSKFKDSDDEDEGPEEAFRQRPVTQARAPRSSPSLRQAIVRDEPKPADLFGEIAPVYKSAGRRKPTNNVSSTPAPSTPRAPTPQLKTRTFVPADANQIANSAAKKAKGNEYFKLGQFSDASEAYHAAILALPRDHLLLVPLLNNRAASLSKQGDHAGAIAETTKVIEIIGLDYNPTKEHPLPKDLDVKLHDGLFKALSKRASAYEMAEKWMLAKDDWEKLMGSPVAGLVFAAPGGANQRKLVSDGIARTRRMLSGDIPKAPPKSVAVKPAARSKPSTTEDLSASKGVTRMREAAAARETEDAQRLALKAGVDSKITIWSNGKETNLRGLLSSLDLVLWDGLGVKKPSMAELITDKQVKIGYMRVIGKLHPDKLTSANTTVEQRMIANSVFGILNEAWHAFTGLT